MEAQAESDTAAKIEVRSKRRLKVQGLYEWERGIRLGVIAGRKAALLDSQKLRRHGLFPLRERVRVRGELA